MRVLQIVGDSKFGGASVVVLRIAETVRNATGWDTVVLTTDGRFQEVLGNHGIGYLNLDVIRRAINPIADLRGLLKLCQYLRREKYDIVHTHTSKGGVIGRIAARLAGVPIIVHTVHGFAFHTESSHLETGLYAAIERVAALFCDCIITVSEYHRNLALRLRIGHSKKVQAIKNGIPPERAVAAKSSVRIREELGVSESDLIILATGRLAKQKGFEFLIRAVPTVLDELGSSFKVVLVGDGPLRVELERLAVDHGVQDQVSFVGFRSDIANWLAAGDIVVLPSLWEGLSIALLEAMAAGKPIVTTSIPSNLEVVRHEESALVVPPKDPGLLAQAIIRLAREPELRRKLGSEARRVYQADYTEDRMLDDYLKVYVRLAREKGLISD